MVDAATPRITAGSRGRATAEQVLDAAERLFAERGFDAVSLREIGKATSSRNTAVAHYHFGGKDGLVRAIIVRRAPALNARRLELLAQAEAAAAEQGRDVTVAELVGAVVLPLVEEMGRNSHYVGLLARLATERYRAPWVTELDASATSSYR